MLNITIYNDNHSNFVMDLAREITFVVGRRNNISSPLKSTSSSTDIPLTVLNSTTTTTTTNNRFSIEEEEDQQEQQEEDNFLNNNNTTTSTTTPRLRKSNSSTGNNIMSSSSSSFSYSASHSPPSVGVVNGVLTSTDIEIEEVDRPNQYSPLMGGHQKTDSHSSIECDQRTILEKTVDFIKGNHIYLSRTIDLQLEDQPTKFPPNVVRNQKYNFYTFIFVIFYEQFKYFFNLYFLLVALSQFIPPLQTGYLFTYISPLAFVLSVTIFKEAYDDFKRYRRDKEANSAQYLRLTKNGFVSIPSSDIKVGHYILVETNQRVPCDMIFLRTTEKNGASFIRTDQLDGETDWKLRRSVNMTQKLATDESLLSLRSTLYAEKPKKDIYNFIGNFTNIDSSETESLSVENTLWSNTVIASGNVIGCAIYTGRETRCVMNTSTPSTKTGLLDSELNNLSKVLFALLCCLSLLMITLKGFRGLWYIYLFRYLLLFSAIIPISMRVNLDLGKTIYSWMMMRDPNIPGTIVRSSTIPEELGRIEYLLTDKTGTLTQNDMVFKKLHLGTVAFSKESLQDLENELRLSYSQAAKNNLNGSSSNNNSSRNRKNFNQKIRESITAIALCHNVTPVIEDESSHQQVLEIKKKKKKNSVSSFFSNIVKGGDYEKLSESDLKKKSDDYQGSSDRNISSSGEFLDHDSSNAISAKHQTYQASSPDEIALVKFTESIRLVLTGRELHTITLLNPMGEEEHYEILNIFPFTSETKRMGIIVRDKDGIITFYMKGADAIMAKLVQSNDWLEEECGNMAREGLRTLAFGKRTMSEQEYHNFSKLYADAKTTISDRAAKVQEAISTIEKDLELIALTGVEDKLQTKVKPTLEMLRNADVKVWMLTGDKIETATCIAISTKLVSRTQSIFQISVNDKNRALEKLNQFSRMRDACLVIDGHSLQMCLDNFKEEFINIATKAPSVVCCRCTPTQKADIVRLIKEKTKKRTCAIGDGGNDVSMIQAADVGVGIVGKEGKQASLAADFSITQFSFLANLILWHGRNSYKRSARMSQFVIHRGLIISFIQCVFSAIYYFAAISIYNGMLLVGYATLYTNAPVFSLVLDEDVPQEIAFRYPELYHELQKGRSLSYKTFFIWVLKSVYQGGAIMLLSIILFESSLNNIVSITFTSLILCELLNVATEIHTWHKYMIASIIVTLLSYLITMMIPQILAFELSFILSFEFVWKVAVITVVSCLPLYLIKFISRKIDPPSYTKLTYR
ncbi:hypothetical protein CYY_005353 [Polysphondylium violaceum]|uniref:Phospholipid-transporting ATPase n=1 Tax=Polysphondylium violaceum TaxID=133409 RepID=A0A8J4UYP7_9MYCE|nr:hypothetical protein CYY_005353 [Polysphondylium violaceum]